MQITDDCVRVSVCVRVCVAGCVCVWLCCILNLQYFGSFDVLRLRAGHRVTPVQLHFDRCLKVCNIFKSNFGHFMQLCMRLRWNVVIVVCVCCKCDVRQTNADAGADAGAARTCVLLLFDFICGHPNLQLPFLFFLFQAFVSFCWMTINATSTKL